MTAELRAHIRRLVDEAPPLSETQRARLAVILAPVRRPGLSAPVARRRPAPSAAAHAA